MAHSSGASETLPGATSLVENIYCTMYSRRCAALQGCQSYTQLQHIQPQHHLLLLQTPDAQYPSNLQHTVACYKHASLELSLVVLSCDTTIKLPPFTAGLQLPAWALAVRVTNSRGRMFACRGRHTACSCLAVIGWGMTRDAMQAAAASQNLRPSLWRW